MSLFGSLFRKTGLVANIALRKTSLIANPLQQKKLFGPPGWRDLSAEITAKKTP